MVKKKKKKLNIKRTLAFLLCLYIICCGIFFLLKQPIRHIEISGNNILKDSTIIKAAGIENYPSIFKYTSWNLEKKIKKLDLVEDVDVIKWFDFTVKIKIKENKILFYYQNNKKIVLSNGDIINNDLKKVYGIPILLNSIDSKLLKDFVNNFSKINENILSEISTIEYFSEYTSNEIVDTNVFKIIMNDGNTVIANIKNCEFMNKYNEIYASLGDRKGILRLDNKLTTESNFVFMPYEE